MILLGESVETGGESLDHLPCLLLNLLIIEIQKAEEFVDIVLVPDNEATRERVFPDFAALDFAGQTEVVSVVVGLEVGPDHPGLILGGLQIELEEVRQHEEAILVFVPLIVEQLDPLFSAFAVVAGAAIRERGTLVHAHFAVRRKQAEPLGQNSFEFGVQLVIDHQVGLLDFVGG